MALRDEHGRLRMRIYSWDEAMSGAFGDSPEPAAATVGVFDGLHRGHLELVRRVVGSGLHPLVFTFRGNPKRETAPHRPTAALFSLSQKLEALAAEGVQTLVLIDFSPNFSKLHGKDFIASLVGSCGVRSFVVGSDFKCGYRLSTDARDLMRIAPALGAQAEVVEPLLYDGEPVSSSRIRHAVSSGRMDLALAMLGRPYALDLRGAQPETAGGIARVCLHGAGLQLPGRGLYRALADGEPALVRAFQDGRLEWESRDGAVARILSFPEQRFEPDGPQAARQAQETGCKE